MEKKICFFVFFKLVLKEQNCIYIGTGGSFLTYPPGRRRDPAGRDVPAAGPGAGGGDPTALRPRPPAKRSPGPGRPSPLRASTAPAGR